ncbi:MAG: DNA cytosine methyltransferase [Myxococcota bacterium]
MRVLELFAGIGGCAAALAEREGVEVVAAIDHDEAAHATYCANYAHPAFRINLASISIPRLAAFEADAWWMSPPCQPFTVRGHRRDIDDPRCQALLHLIEALEAVQPRWLGLENVPGFAGSIAHTRLIAMLRTHGYSIQQGEICPTWLGIPNERRRFYLVAERGAARPVDFRGAFQAPPVRRSLASYLDPHPDPALVVPKAIVTKYAQGLAVVDPTAADAVAHCFTAAYGRSWVYSGSYLKDGLQIRRFSPAEITRLLGFPDTYRPPVGRKAFKLVGNALSVDVVKAILADWGPR